MITAIRLVNFKNFADETLRVGPFTVIVGANASGKSNIRDAFRFLHGIGRGYTLAEIIGGKYGPGGQREWEPIRGAGNEIARFGPLHPHMPSEFSLHVELKLSGIKTYYSIKVGLNPTSSEGFRVLEEELRTESTMVYTTIKTSESSLWLLVGENDEKQIGLSRSQPALTQFLQKYKEIWYQQIFDLGLLSVLESMRFLDLSPDRMREAAFPGQHIMGDSGENLSIVLQQICADSKRKKILSDWLRELTPMDVQGFEFPRDPSGRVHLRLCEANGRKVSAYSASDGTLRFLAMLATLLGEKPKGLYFFEEIDTGIHPARLHLLMDLIERQTAKQGIQVITSTHAPTLLAVMNDSTFENTSVVCRLEDSSNAIIRPVTELPNVRELRQDQGLGRLHESGWMENALYFTEDYDEKDFVAVDQLRDKMRDNDPDYVETQIVKAVAEVNAKS